MLRRTGSAIAALAALVGLVLVAVPASAAPAACGITWGSGAKSSDPTPGGDMVGLRAGRHDCYDRLVFDMRGSGSGYWVSYVDDVTMDGSGEPVPLRGGAKLHITVYSPAYNDNFEPTYEYDNPAELVNVTGFQTFRQVAWAGSWEGTTSVGLGVRALLPFRAFTVGNHVVVDVAHVW